MRKKKMLDLQMSELFLVKADWDRTFMATIVREKNNDGKEVIRGSVVVNEGKIWCIAESEEELGNDLDDICIMKLDCGLHEQPGITLKIAGVDFFLN